MYKFGLDIDDLIEVTPEPTSATIETIRSIEVNLGFSLPDDYVRFMNYANGGTILPGEGSYLILFPVEELLGDTESYSELYGGAVFFGSDGGLESYAFDARTKPISIVEVDRVAGMDSAILVGNTLRELIRYAYHKVDKHFE
ncbi:MAG TPA: SMI1/KNR4 family protein [Chloroflexia bacterium]|nr:SMI1/KNR4 family protein [Chloroflexia bacterium]